MAIIAEQRKVDMKTVLSYPLGPLPWSLVTPDGLMRKITMSKLMEVLTKDFATAEGIPREDFNIIDGMYIVQKLPQDYKHLDK